MTDDKSLDEVPITRNLMAVACAMLDGYGYTYLEVDPTTVQLSIGRQHGIYLTYITANDESDFVRVICHYGAKVPVDRRAAVMEAITRINWRHGIGGFDMDLSDGEVRFRIGMDVENGLLSEKMVDNMLGFSLYSMDRYHESLMRIAFGDADPETAIVEVP